MKHARATMAAVMMGLAAAAGQAVEAPEPGWTVTPALYGWLTQLDGDIGLGPVSVPVDFGFDDSLDALQDLEGALMLHVEARRDALTLIGDVYFVSLDVTQSTPAGDASIELKQTIGEAAVAYALPIEADKVKVEALAGGRYEALDVGVDIHAVGVSADGDESWLDPLVGARVSFAASPAVQLALRGDVGGFGVGSDLSWNGVASAQWTFAEHWSLVLAYRILDVDYDDDNFRYNVREDGPGVGIGYTW